MTKFSILLLLCNAPSAVAFSTILPHQKPATSLFISSNFGDPAALETVNGSLAEEPTLEPIYKAEEVPATTEPLTSNFGDPFAGVETRVAVQEEVKPYTAAPLATVSTKEATQKYNGLPKLAAPSKRHSVVGLQDIIKQQQVLNIHVHNNGGNGDTTRDLNTEFTTFC